MPSANEPEFQDEEWDEEFDELSRKFRQHINDFAEDHDLSFGTLAVLTMEMSLTARMLDYVTSVDKPSNAGLKLELDRYHREVEESVRMAKKGADEFLASTKEALAEARSTRDSDTPE